MLSIESLMDEALHAFVEMLIGYFQNPFQLTPTALTDTLYGNFLGLALTLSAMTAIALLALSVFIPKLFVNAFHAMLVAIAMVPFGPLFFGFSDWLRNSGSQLTIFVRDIAGTNASPEMLEDKLNVGNLVLDVIAFILIMIFGIIIILQLVLFEFVAVYAKLLILPVISLWATSDKMKNTTDSIIGLWFVSIFLGRFVVVGITSIGLAIADTVRYEGAFANFIGVLIIVMSFIIATVVNWGLFKSSKRIVSRVSRGNMMAKVRGDVSTTPKGSTPHFSRVNANAKHVSSARTMTQRAMTTTKNTTFRKAALMTAKAMPQSRVAIVAANFIGRRSAPPDQPKPWQPIQRTPQTPKQSNAIPDTPWPQQPKFLPPPTPQAPEPQPYPQYEWPR